MAYDNRDLVVGLALIAASAAKPIRRLGADDFYTPPNKERRATRTILLMRDRLALGAACRALIAERGPLTTRELFLVLGDHPLSIRVSCNAIKLTGTRVNATHNVNQTTRWSIP